MSIKYKNSEGSIIEIPTGGGGGNANIWEGTAAELEEIEDTLEEGTVVLVNDDMPQGGGASTADKVKCTDIEGNESNVQTELDKSSVEISTLNTNLTWKLAFKNSNSNEVINENLPDNYKELLINIYSSDGLHAYDYYLIKEMLDTASRTYRGGCYVSSTIYGDAYVEIDKTKIVRFILRKNGSNIPSTLEVYYR